MSFGLYVCFRLAQYLCNWAEIKPFVKLEGFYNDLCKSSQFGERDSLGFK